MRTNDSLTALWAQAQRRERQRKALLRAYWPFTPAQPQRLLCCGAWQPLTGWPHACRYCRRHYHHTEDAHGRV